MLLKDKKIVIFGVANKYSIATGIAKSMHQQGAKLAFAYQNERLLKNIKPIAEELGSEILIECDVSDDNSIDQAFKDLTSKWQKFDGLVHSIGFAPADQLEGNFVDVTTREGFKIAHDISSYSFTALAKASKPYLNENAALLTLTYLGSIQTLPNYNVMGLAKASLEASVRYMAADLGSRGIRVNAISAGPIRTLAAGGIPGFDRILDHVERNSPLRRNTTQQDVAGAAVWLASPLSGAVTGQILHVDCGYSITMVPESIND